LIPVRTGWRRIKKINKKQKIDFILMLTVSKIVELEKIISNHRQSGKKIGFVPTMGALHEGHLTLIVEALQENDIVVCSIFVNPTQFNDPEDLKKYPRPLEKDTSMLDKVGCHYLFLPEVAEIYPENLPKLNFDLKGLDLPMEGAKRPGHFKGVVQVVHRLLDIVKPDALYMGQKDFQQYSIIAEILSQMNSKIKLVRVPIVREDDGLAMSSRNIRLSKDGRSLAPILYKVLQEVEHYVHSQPFPTPQSATDIALDLFRKNGINEIDYFEIVDGRTLKKILSFEETDFAVVCAVVIIDGVRLLDNIILFENA
jgi:pantoate--beta-alanine ligase